METRTLASAAIGGCRIEAVLGDMTSESTDAIVNAANTRLEHGGGLAGAIVRTGGDAIQRESDRLAPIEAGGAVTTSAGSLPCGRVIHAVGPRWGEGDEETKLRSAVRSALSEAERIGARTVSLPAISTGIFGYPKADGVRVIVDEIRRHLEPPTAGLSGIRLVAFDEPTARLFSEAVSRL